MKSLIKKLTVVILALIISFNTSFIVRAEGNTLKDKGIEISSSAIDQIKLDLSKVVAEETNINRSSECSTKGCNMTPNKAFTVRYREALNYGNDKVDIKMTITRTSESINPSYMYNDTTSTENMNTIKMLSNNKIEFIALGEIDKPNGYDNRYNKRSVVEVKIEFMLPDNTPYPISGLMGIVDPDGGDYEFDTTGRKIYYSIEPANENTQYGEQTIETSYEVRNNGLYRIDMDGENWKVPYWNESKLAVELNNDTSFEITYNAVYDLIELPTLYAFYYNVTYDMNDEDGPAATNPNADFTKYVNGDEKQLADPERPGYKFTGWTRQDLPATEELDNDSVTKDDTGDKHFIAHWEAIEYQLAYDPNEESIKSSVEGEMDNQTATIGDNTLNENKYSAKGYKFVGWNESPDNTGNAYDDKGNVPITADDVKDKKDGDVVKTLYAQWEPITYTVKYDPNGGVGNMDDQTPLEYDTEYNLNKNKYTREGYDWIGWNTAPDNSEIPYSDEEDFINLTDEDGGTITMYAQWDPWKYYIKYDGNGGTGTMNKQTFTYQDDVMTSKRNEFVRDGYRFTGFKYEYNGDVRIVRTIDEFRDMLVELGPGSAITLVAQWERIPEGYNAPVTGVE